MAAINIQSLTAAGLAPTLRAAAAGDTITPRSSTDVASFLYVLNGSGAPITVTLTDASVTAAGSAATNPAITCANGTTPTLIAINPKLANPNNGTIPVAYSATATVTVGYIGH